MEVESRAPFEEILSSLFADEIGPIHHLYRLSDMDEAEDLEFRNRWPTASDTRRLEIVRHLADISEANFTVDFSPVFRSSLHDPFAPVRIAALDGLWDSTDATLVNPILDLLKSGPTPEVRAAAARSIAHFILMSEWDQVRGVNVEQVFQTLLVIYQHLETPLSVRCAVLEAMGPISLPEIAVLIEDAYEGYVLELQLSAVFAMGNSADPRWLPILLDEMESPSVDMRAEAARAAGTIGRSEAIPQLAELCYDDDDDVAMAAINALAQIGGDEVSRILEELLADPQSAHLHEVVEEALEESQGLDSELPITPWSKDEIN